MRSFVLCLLAVLAGCATTKVHETPPHLEELRYVPGEAKTVRYDGDVETVVPTDPEVIVRAVDLMRRQIYFSDAFTCRYMKPSSGDSYKDRCVYYFNSKPIAVVVEGMVIEGREMTPYLK